MTENYYALGAVNILAMSILGWMVNHNDLFDARTRRHFLASVLSIAIVVLAELGTVFDGYPARISLFMNNIFNIIGFSLSPFVPVMIAKALSNRSLRWSNAMLIAPVVNLVLAVLSPAWGFIFRILPDGSYFRGTFFFVYILSYISGMIFLLVETFRVIRKYQSKGQESLVWLFLLFIFGTVLQLLFPHLHTAWPSVSLAMVLYYAFYSDLLERHDALTNLLNRRSYEYHLARLETKGHAAVIMMDVNGLKEANDRFGHPYGDESLRVIAGILSAVFGKIGTCFRIGGDEFCVLTRQTDEQMLKSAEESFLKRMAVAAEEDSRFPSISLGHAFFLDPHQGIGQAVKEADQRMFAQKQQNKQAKMQQELRN